VTDLAPLHVLGFAGSLRAGSVNRALLRAARDLAPVGMTVETVGLGDLPLYNADLDTDEARPEAVVRFKAQIAVADGLLIATPEYNHNVSGVLQNAIDWASRPAHRSPFVGKPVAIMGAASGAIGSARAQEQLKVVLMATLAHVFPHRGVIVGGARQKFGDPAEAGQAPRLTDEPTRDFLAAYLRDFAVYARRLAG
jgi:chromate reductase